MVKRDNHEEYVLQNTPRDDQIARKLIHSMTWKMKK